MYSHRRLSDASLHIDTLYGKCVYMPALRIGCQERARTVFAAFRLLRHS